MTAAAPVGEPGGDPATVDDQFRALMEGLRTTLPGVQVLFGFLLAYSFQAGFDRLSTSERLVFYTAFVSAGAASILLIAPSAHQRLRIHHTDTVTRRTESHLRVAVALTNAGTAVFAVAMAASVYLVGSLVSGGVLAGLSTAVAVVLMIVSWFYLPLLRWR